MRPGALALLFMAGFPAAHLAAQDPADEVIAVVLGEEIRRGRAPEMDGERLMGIVMERLIERYAGEADVEPEESEIEALVEIFAPPPGEPTISAETGREVAHRMIRSFKIKQSLYEAYGGRVIFQQMGPEPIDAYREFLEAQQEAGAFEIRDPSLEGGFWRYLVDDAIHSFYPPEEAKAAMTRPWWDADPPDERQ